MYVRIPEQVVPFFVKNCPSYSIKLAPECRYVTDFTGGGGGGCKIHLVAYEILGAHFRP